MAVGSKQRGWPVHSVTFGWALLTAAALLLPPSNLAGWMPAIPWLRLAMVFAGWGLDKLVHGALFAILVWLAVRSARLLALRRPALASAALASIYAVGTEAAQHWVPGRRADLLDFAADLVGVVLGAWLAHRASGQRRPARRPAAFGL